MTITMKIIKIAKCIFITLGILAALDIVAIAPDLTLPRVGDNIAVFRLTHKPAFLDSLSLNPDLSDIELERFGDLKIWPPSAADSVSTHIMTLGRDVFALVQSEDTIRQISKTSPGYFRSYDYAPVYGYTNMTKICEFCSQGHWDNIGSFKTSGRQSASLIKDLTFISADGDTLPNIECCQYNIIENFVFDQEYQAVFKSVIRKWYAPGYRYPLLIHEDGVMLSEYADTLDAVSTWYMTDPKMQVESIENDPVNTAIRQQQILARRHFSHHGISMDDSNGSFGSNGIKYNQEINILSVSPCLENAVYQSFLLCDITGIVYRSGDMPAEGISIDTSNLRPGEYLFYVSTTALPLVYKFKVK